MDEVLKDKRFAHIAKDPRYRRIPREERKVKIDTRFKSMFEDKSFKLKYSVDKRGRPVNLTTNENLRKFYDLSDDDTSDDDDDEKGDTGSSEDTERTINERDSKEVELKTAEQSKSTSKQYFKAVKKNEKGTKKVKKQEQDSSSDDISSGDEDSEEESDEGELIKKTAGSGADIARGDGNIESSSSDDDDEGEGQSDDDEFDHKWGEVDSSAATVSDATSRLAVCNMDWDRVKAKDIFAILNSFKPAAGIIKSIKVYPSEYGQARLEEEQAQGPRELIDDRAGDEGEDGNVEDNEGTRYHTEKLRKYQLNRLKYYYAVVECDSAVTAGAIYGDCDAMEYETSSTKLDLRYIPDEMEFEQEATSECTEMPHGYKPILFANTALSQSKVDLTWDETDQERVRSTAQVWASKVKDVPEDDLKAYLASSSDEEGPDYGPLLDQSDGGSDSAGEDEDRQIAKYKSLIQDIDTDADRKKSRGVEMEITWEPGLKETTEGIIKKKKDTKVLSPWEDYLQRKKEKKKKKREERKKKHDTDDDVAELEQEPPVDGDAAFSDDELPAGVDMDDPFFSQEVKARDSQKTDKKKKKKKDKKNVSEENTQEQAELSLLVMDEEEDKRHFNLSELVEDTKHKKRTKKKQKEKEENKDADNFQVNVADPRFAAMFESHHYNIDPSAPEYKKTKGTEAIISEKLKRRRDKGRKQKDNSAGDGVVKDKKRKTEAGGAMPAAAGKDNSLAMLVKSVKVKTQQFQSNKKR